MVRRNVNNCESSATCSMADHQHAAAVGAAMAPIEPNKREKGEIDSSIEAACGI